MSDYETKDMADHGRVEKKGGYPSGDAEVGPTPAPSGEAPGAQHMPQSDSTGQQSGGGSDE